MVYAYSHLTENTKKNAYHSASLSILWTLFLSHISLPSKNDTWCELNHQKTVGSWSDARPQRASRALETFITQPLTPPAHTRRGRRRSTQPEVGPAGRFGEMLKESCWSRAKSSRRCAPPGGRCQAGHAERTSSRPTQCRSGTTGCSSPSSGGRQNHPESQNIFLEQYLVKICTVS